MQVGGHEKHKASNHPILAGKSWIGKETEEAAIQEFPSDEVIYLNNQPTCWQFAYSEDRISFIFIPDYQFEEILSRFLDKLEEEGVISISKVKNACYHDFLNKKFREVVK